MNRLCVDVCWPGQRVSLASRRLRTQWEVPVLLHPLIMPAARQTVLLTHTHTPVVLNERLYY